VTIASHVTLKSAVVSFDGGKNMGKGDRRTLRGKLFRGSYGKRRAHRTNRPQPELQPPATTGQSKSSAPASA